MLLCLRLGPSGTEQEQVTGCCER